jgi:hypothetical protein
MNIAAGEGSITAVTLKGMALLFPDLAPGADRVVWEALARGDPDFLEALRRDGVTPLLYGELIRQGREGLLSPALLLQLRQDYATSLKGAARQEQDVFQVLQVLHEAGVDIILLKGADLRLRLYGDPAQRPMTDLDLLIHKAQLTQAREALTRLNYQVSPFFTEPHPGFRELFGNDLGFQSASGRSLPVDLHWEIRAAAGFYRLTYQPLREQADSLDYRGIPVKLLAPTHALIHLCLHTFEDFCDAGRIAFNTRQIIELTLAFSRLPPDWPRFLAELTRFQCQAPVLVVLRELNGLFPALIPSEVLASLADYHPPLAERLLLSGRLGPLTNYLAICYHHPGRDWVRYLAAKLWPDTHYLRVNFGHARRTAYLKQFLQKFFPGARRAGIGNPQHDKGI